MTVCQIIKYKIVVILQQSCDSGIARVKIRVNFAYHLFLYLSDFQPPLQQSCNNLTDRHSITVPKNFNGFCVCVKCLRSPLIYVCFFCVSGNFSTFKWRNTPDKLYPKVSKVIRNSTWPKMPNYIESSTFIITEIITLRWVKNAMNSFFVGQQPLKQNLRQNWWG